jgi:hypothetical protein
MTKRRPTAEPDEVCHICQPHKTFKHDAIVAHIKHVHGIPGCSRKTIDEYNKSDDDGQVTAEDAHEVVTAALKDILDEEAKNPLQEFVDQEEQETCSVNLRGLDLFPEVPEEKAVEFTKADVEGAREWDFTKEDGHTIDAYLGDTAPNQTIRYHFEWLTSCVAVATNTSMFIVKQRIDNRTVWNEMTNKALAELLSTKSALIMHNGRSKDWLYAKLLDVPIINNAFKRYDCVDFATGNPRVFDIWNGYAFAVMPKEEPVKMELLQPYLDHLLEIICSGNTEHYLTLLMKDAWMFQHPNGHLQYATVLMGEEGAGKGRYNDVLCDLWGEQWTQRNINTMDQITSGVQRDLIANKKLIVPNELASLEQGGARNQKAGFDVLKSRITDDCYVVRNIYERAVKVRNVNNYIFSTNNWDSIRMGLRDRRYFVLEVSDRVLQDTVYFGQLCRSFTDEMKKHLLNFYLRFNTEDFNPFIPPMTALKEEIQASQLHPTEQWVQQ